MNSRERILQRLYASQTSAQNPDQNPDQTSQTTGIQAEHAAGWTQLAQNEWLASFKQNLLDNHAEVIETTTANWAGELAQQLTERGVKRLLSGEHEHGRVLLNALAQYAVEQPSAVIDAQLVTTAFSKEELFLRVDAGFSVASAGLAETGSLLLETGPQEPRALSLVPPLNIILLNASAITASFLTLVQAQQLPAQLPTNVLLISGPSKTADIQQTLAYGAHGPKELIVLLLTDA